MFGSGPLVSLYSRELSPKSREKVFFGKYHVKFGHFVYFLNPEIPGLKHRQSRVSGLRKWAGIPGFGIGIPNWYQNRWPLSEIQSHWFLKCCKNGEMHLRLLRCISPFLPCDAIHGICDRNSVCPSDRPSVTLVDCVHMVWPTIMISSPYGSPIILVSGDITFIPKFEGDHPERGRWMRVGGYWVRIGNFRPISRRITGWTVVQALC